MPNDDDLNNEEFMAKTAEDAVRYVQEKYAQGPRFVEAEGPAVERELIRRCILNQLDPYATIDVAERVLTYRRWFKAWKEILNEVRRDAEPDAGVES